MLSWSSRILCCLLLSSVSAGWFSNCGQMSSTCSTSTSVHTPHYLALSAADKAAKIMENVMEDTTSADWLSSLQQSSGILTEKMCPTFTTAGDEMPWERKQVFYGLLAPSRGLWMRGAGSLWHKRHCSNASEKSSTSRWTTLFTGSQHVIIRMSLAKQPDPQQLQTAPGIGLKFLRDGVASGNMVAMFSVDGQQSWNFFKNNFTNHIPALTSPSLIPLGIKFATATRNVQQVGLSDMARYDQTGAEVSSPSYPFSLNFVPTGEISFPDEYVQPFTTDLMSIPSGAVLYKVFALDKPVELGGSETEIAELVLTSSPTTSRWGDQHLFFRHQTVEDDTALQPSWSQYLEQWDSLSIQTCPSLSLL